MKRVSREITCISVVFRSIRMFGNIWNVLILNFKSKRKSLVFETSLVEEHSANRGNSVTNEWESESTKGSPIRRNHFRSIHLQW